MSATTDKSTRRELRRAVGEEAQKIVNEHTGLLDAIIPQLAALEARGDYFEREIADLRMRARAREDRLLLAETENVEQLARHVRLLTDFEAFRGLRFWSRLRWVLCG